MRNRFQTVRACLLIVPVLWFVSAAARGAIEADPGVQDEIQRVVTSVVAAAGGGDTTAILERIRSLEEAVGGNRPSLLSQLAIYLAGAEGTEKAMSAALVFNHFDFSPREIVAVIVPQLEVEDPGLRQVFEGLLATVDRPDGAEPDFGSYVSYLREAELDPPSPLIAYLYDVAPPQALTALADVYVEDPDERESLDRAARLTSGLFGAERDDKTARVDVVEQLDRLSRSDRWWVRLFVRELVEDVPGYASPALSMRLQSDEHPLVREGTKR